MVALSSWRRVHLLVGSDWNCKSPEMNRPILNFYINTLKPFNVTTVAVSLSRRFGVIKTLLLLIGTRDFQR